jgi:hypothetical protein
MHRMYLVSHGGPLLTCSCLRRPRPLALMVVLVTLWRRVVALLDSGGWHKRQRTLARYQGEEALKQY